MAETSIHDLPEDCLAQVISFTTPINACKSSTISTMFHNAAESDFVWDKFLPCDYRDIVSNLVTPMEFSSKKDLFFKLSAPLLIDGGNKTFAIDKYTNKKCYMLSARELSITWASNPLCWSWKPLPHSRFSKGVELIMIWWLEIYGVINTRMLSKNTTYGAYLVVKLANRAFGLDLLPSEVSIEFGDYKSTRITYLRGISECKKQDKEHDFMGHKIDGLSDFEAEECILHMRDDGWLEVELGEFYCDGNDREVKMSFKEVKGEHLKGGLLVEGIEIRPMH